MRTFHQRTSACTSRRVRSAASRCASRSSRRAGACATYAGPARYAPPTRTDHQLRATATPLPSRWLHGFTVRVGTGVGRLLALARRELTAAALVPAP